MFIKESSRRRKDGSQVTYLQLVVSQWDARRKTSRQRVLHNLGRKDQLDQPALSRLAASLARYLDPNLPQEPQAPQKASQDTSGRPVRHMRPLGTSWLLHALFAAQGWSRAFGPSQTPGAANALFVLVAARVLGLEHRCVPTLDTFALPGKAWTPPSSPQERAQTLPATRGPASYLHTWPHISHPNILFVCPHAAHFSPDPDNHALRQIAIATDLQGSLAAHCVHAPQTQALQDFLNSTQAHILTLHSHQSWEDTDLSRAHHHQIWHFATDAHPDFLALSKSRGRYRKINGELSFRQSLFTQQGRRYRAFLVRSPDDTHILLTDQHQTEPEDLILGAQHHQNSLTLLQNLRDLPRQPLTEVEALQDLWLDLCACAFRLHVQRHTGLDWPTLLTITEGLYALQHEGDPMDTWIPTQATKALQDLYSALELPLPKTPLDA